MTTIIGFVLVALGIGSKGAAICMTGYNTYYWYDMVLNTPNAYFVEAGIYKYCGSPTYTLYSPSRIKMSYFGTFSNTLVILDKVGKGEKTHLSF